MTRPQTILVVGRAGQLAQCLSRLDGCAETRIVCLGRPDLDIGDASAVKKALKDVRPSAIINAAAYTAVDKAETEPDEAYRINCIGPALLAAAARDRAIPFIHVSTDYVFDGSQTEPYLEGDATDPQGVYGHSKLEGEIAISKVCPEAVIVRTAWVYSAFGANFLKTMIRLAGNQPVVRIVDDQRGTPTSAHELAPALLKVAKRLLQPHPKELGGIYHLTAGGQTTWHGFAAEIFDGMRCRGLRVPKLKPIETKDYPTPAKRPAYSVLDCAKIERVFGVRMQPWRRPLVSVLDQLVVQKELETC